MVYRVHDCVGWGVRSTGGAAVESFPLHWHAHAEVGTPTDGEKARARALVLPSISEGMPRIVAEALLTGLPVVASAVGAVPDVVREGETGYLAAAGDVEQLAAALMKTLHNADIDAMGERARTFAAGAFSSESFVNGHRELLVVLNAEF